jgi:hypothetical protein
MKLVVCITLFDGYELLAECIENFRHFADEIVICYQTVSNTGLEDSNVAKVIQSYEFSGDIHIIQYHPDPSLLIKQNERRKHNIMVQEAKRLGATHFIMSAVDHFYNVEQVNSVLDRATNYDVTFTKIKTYYKNPTWQITPDVPWVMPFICRMNPDTEVTFVPNFPLRVDAAVKIKPLGNWYLFDEQDIVLHNYSNVRDNFDEKLKNADLPLLWSKKKKQAIAEQFHRYDPASKEPILYYNYSPTGTITTTVPDYFHLND